MAKKINRKEILDDMNKESKKEIFKTAMIVVLVLVIAVGVLYFSNTLDDTEEKSGEIADAVCSIGFQFKGAEFVNKTGDKYVYRCRAHNITLAPEGDGLFSISGVE